MAKQLREAITIDEARRQNLKKTPFALRALALVCWKCPKYIIDFCYGPADKNTIIIPGEEIERLRRERSSRMEDL